MTEKMVRGPLGIRDDDVADLRRHFDEAEIVELLWSIGLFHGLNAFNIALDVEPEAGDGEVDL